MGALAGQHGTTRGGWKKERRSKQALEKENAALRANSKFSSTDMRRRRRRRRRPPSASASRCPAAAVTDSSPPLSAHAAALVPPRTPPLRIAALVGMWDPDALAAVASSSYLARVDALEALVAGGEKRLSGV